MSVLTPLYARHSNVHDNNSLASPQCAFDVRAPHVHLARQDVNCKSERLAKAQSRELNILQCSSAALALSAFDSHRFAAIQRSRNRHIGHQRVARARPLPISLAARSTGIGLHGRALVRSVRAVHAAVARLRVQDGLANLAFVEPLTGIRRHRLLLGVTAFRAGDDGNQFDRFHVTENRFDDDAQAACAAAMVSASGVALGQ